MFSTNDSYLVWLGDIPDFIYFADNISIAFVQKFNRFWQFLSIVDTEAELSNFGGGSMEAEIEKQMLFQ